jgi:hypothetical protein
MFQIYGGYLPFNPSLPAPPPTSASPAAARDIDDVNSSAAVEHATECHPSALSTPCSTSLPSTPSSAARALHYGRGGSNRRPSPINLPNHQCKRRRLTLCRSQIRHNEFPFRELIKCV